MEAWKGLLLVVEVLIFFGRQKGKEGAEKEGKGPRGRRAWRFWLMRFRWGPIGGECREAIATNFSLYYNLSKRKLILFWGGFDITVSCCWPRVRYSVTRSSCSFSDIVFVVSEWDPLLLTADNYRLIHTLVSFLDWFVGLKKVHRIISNTFKPHMPWVCNNIET